MNITLKNYEVLPAIDFLESMRLSARDSRPVMKFAEHLRGALKSLGDSQMALIEKYGEKDENGELIMTEDETDYLICPERQKEYQAELVAFLQEEVVFTGGFFVKVMERLPAILSEYDEKISGKQAVIYNRLLDEFEKEEREEHGDI